MPRLWMFFRGSHEGGLGKCAPTKNKGSTMPWVVGTYSISFQAPVRWTLDACRIVCRKTMKFEYPTEEQTENRPIREQVSARNPTWPQGSCKKPTEFSHKTTHAVNYGLKSFRKVRTRCSSRGGWKQEHFCCSWRQAGVQWSSDNTLGTVWRLKRAKDGRSWCINTQCRHVPRHTVNSGQDIAFRNFGTKFR